MKIEQIITNRSIDGHHANDLVYEWEDQMAEALGATLHHNHPWHNERYSKWIAWLLCLMQTNRPAFTFEMCTFRHAGNNKRNIVPCIIDYYLRKPLQVRYFLWTYRNNPRLLISSREAYEYLLTFKAARGKVLHFPLSLADRYRVTPGATFQKDYDLLLVGRQNRVLQQMLNDYRQRHPELRVVEVRDVEGTRWFCCGGQQIRPSEGRDNYITTLRQCRMALYSTPGIDGGEVRTQGFSQVTPRYLEMLALGCHILARYRDNADTEFFQLGRFTHRIETQQDFDQAMQLALTTEVDMSQRIPFLNQHYTSTRVEMLEQIISDIK